MKMINTIKPFFEPRGVAVIGASSNPEKLSHGILKNLISYGFEGKVYPVNPGAVEIIGLRCYPDIENVPDPIDLAVIVLPASAIPEVIESCGRRGIKAAIIISGGFQEVGSYGENLQREVLERAAHFRMRIIGPNCVGNINLITGLNTTFIKGLPAVGGIGFVSQSGAVCGAVVDMVQNEGIGFSHFISLGNEADVTESDMIEYLAEDTHTRVIAAYVESIRDGQRFMRAAKTAVLKKPLVILKAGKSEAGAKAVSSHTGSLAGSKDAYSTAFRQSGAIEAETLGDLLRIANAFDWAPLLNGDSIAIITNAGGPAALASDSIAQYHLSLSTLGDNTQSELKKKLVPAAQVGNPVDMLGGAEAGEYSAALQALLLDKNVHACAAILVPQALVKPDGVARAIIENAAGSKIPVIAMMVGKASVEDAKLELSKNHIPCLNLPEQLGPVLGALRQRKIWLAKAIDTEERIFKLNHDDASHLLKNIGIRKNLGEYETRQFLEKYGFPIVKADFASSEEDAVRAAEQIGFPVVMKIVSPDILHKTDQGGIALGITGQLETREAYRELVKNAHSHNHTIYGVLLQPFAKKGIEVIIGFKRDNSFGPVLLVGMGGVWVELIKNFSNRIAPINFRDAKEMIFETHVGKLLTGFRGEKPSDVEAVKKALMLINQIALDFPEIQELEVNPLVVYPEGDGAVALDCRMILS